MTRSEFIEGYMKRSGISIKCDPESGVIFPSSATHPGFIALPCACGEDGFCSGWAKVRNDPESIADHNQFNGGFQRAEE